MSTMSTGKGLLTSLGLLAGAIVLVLAACDSSPVSDDAAAAPESTTGDLAAVITSDLGLSTDQHTQVKSFINANEAGMLEPGFAWRLAAKLQSTLTAEQKEWLLARSEDWLGGRFRRHHERQGFGQRFDGQSGDSPRFGHFRGRGPGAGFLGILTDEQIEQARVIRESYGEQIEAIRAAVQAGEMTREDARQQLQEIHAAVRKEIEALLTDEQRAQLEELRTEREARRVEHREAARLVRDEVLGLDAAGSQALDAILDKFRDAVAAFREEMFDTGADREEVRGAVLSLIQERDVRIGELLDDTAFETFKIHEAIVRRVRGHGLRRGGPGMGFGSGTGFGSGMGFGSYMGFGPGPGFGSGTGFGPGGYGYHGSSWFGNRG